MKTPNTSLIETGDERKGLPSASGFQRLLSCKASWPLTQTLRRNGSLPVDTGSKIAREGDEIHRICQNILQKKVTDEDRAADGFEEAEELVEILLREVGRVFPDISDGERFLIYIEERFWLTHEGQTIASGRFDFIVYDTAERIAFIADFKTGWNETPKGRDNAQLLGGAALLKDWHEDLEGAHLAIIETGSKIVVSEVSAMEIGIFRLRLVTNILEGYRDPLQMAFNATEENCRYCPNRLACPILRHMTGDAMATTITAMMDSRTLEELKDHLKILSSLERAVDSEMEYRIKQGEQFERWDFLSSAGKRKFTNPAAACSVLLGAGATPDRVFRDVTLPIGKAETILKEVSGFKGKELASHFNDKLGAYIDKPEGEPSIKRK